MSVLHNKNILLAVSGGIAAYKSVYLVRRLREQGANVKVVMTTAAQEFVSVLTFQAISGQPVHTSLLDPAAEAAMGHIELARWADLVIVAPATANTLAKLANGNADDLLSTVCLASKAPLFVAPSMNQQMWAQASTQQNIDKLKANQINVLGPASGEQACGDIGEGRMLEPEEILLHIEAAFNNKLLSGVRILITAGPTREAIDPVRYISNHSSGKMGYALAEAALAAGASVELVSGPCQLTTSDRIKLIPVESALEMHQAVFESVDKVDIFIAVAAVADYRLQSVAAQKIKKQADTLTLNLVKNADIVADVAALSNKPFVVGFAAETENLMANAKAKLVAKNLDMIIANQVGNDEAGFNSDNNKATALWVNGEKEFEQSSKTRLASQLIELLASRYKNTVENNE